MKKKYFISAILMFLSISSLNAQTPPNYKWTKTFGGIKEEHINSIVVDKSGNVYSTGSFVGSMDIDPNAATTTINSNGNSDVFISKLDASGNLIWSKNMGGSYTDVGYSITVDTASNVYVTGSFQDYVDFGGPAPLYSSGSEDVFVVKYNSSGMLQWAKSIGGSYADYGRSISVDTLGGLYITGKFKGSVDFDPGSGYVSLVSDAGSEDVFIVKLNQDGAFQWVKGIGDSGYDVGTGIASTMSGEVYVTGIFSGTADFNPLSSAQFLSSQGLLDVYIAKYDKDGIYQWSKSFGGLDNDYSRGIAVDNKSNVYVTGYFSGLALFDPLSLSKKVNSYGGSDGFVSKLDKTGGLNWINQMGGSNSDYGFSVTADDNGNVFTTGSFESVANLDPAHKIKDITSNGGSDIFISKYDGNGTSVWATNLGSNADDEGAAIFVYKNNDIYTGGSFRNSVDFNHETAIANFSSNGSSDAFIHKMSILTNAIQSKLLESQIDIYPNPSDGQVNLVINNTTSAEYLLRVFDMKGSVLSTQNIIGNNAIVDLSHHASGVYFLNLTDTEGAVSKLIPVTKR